MPSMSKRATSAKLEFEATFATLRDVLRRQAPKALVVKDTPGDFQIASPTLVDRIGRPLAVASVQIKKSCVSFHLIPVYSFTCPGWTVVKLKHALPCIRFWSEGETVWASAGMELAALTKRGAAELERIDLPWARKRR